MPRLEIPPTFEWYFNGSRRSLFTFPYVNVAPLQQSGVILVFHDGYASAYTKALPRMKAKGWSGVVAINPPTYIGGSFLTLAQLKELSHNGWEIVSHGKDHVSFGALSRSEIEASIAESKLYIEENIQSPSICFLPAYFVINDKHGNSAVDIVMQYFPYACLGSGTENWDGKPGSFNEGKFPSNNLIALGYLDSWLNANEASPGILLFHIHDFGTADGDISEANFQLMLNKIEARGIPILAFRDVVVRYGLPFAMWKDRKYMTTMNSGTFTGSGDGTTTAFSFPHELASAPTIVEIGKKHADIRGLGWTWGADATNVTITFESAPPAGTNNVVFSWKAEA